MMTRFALLVAVATANSNSPARARVEYPESNLRVHFAYVEEPIIAPCVAGALLHLPRVGRGETSGRAQTPSTRRSCAQVRAAREVGGAAPRARAQGRAHEEQDARSRAAPALRRHPPVGGGARAASQFHARRVDGVLPGRSRRSPASRVSSAREYPPSERSLHGRRPGGFRSRVDR